MSSMLISAIPLSIGNKQNMGILILRNLSTEFYHMFKYNVEVN